MMFSHLHPMLLHTDMLQGISARDPTFPRVDCCHISCLAGSSCCTSSRVKSSCHRKNTAYNRGTVTHSLCGLQKTYKEQSFFCMREPFVVLIHGTAEGFRPARQSDHFPLLWEGAGRMCRKTLPKAALTLVMVPAHAGLGDPLTVFICQGEPS